MLATSLRTRRTSCTTIAAVRLVFSASSTRSAIAVVRYAVQRRRELRRRAPRFRNGKGALAERAPPFSAVLPIEGERTISAARLSSPLRFLPRQLPRARRRRRHSWLPLRPCWPRLLPC